MLAKESDRYTANEEHDSDDSEKPFLVNAEKEPLEPEKAAKDIKWKFIECGSLFVFTTIQVFTPILVRVAHKHAAHNGVSFLGSTTVFMTEILKTLFCCIILPISNRSFRKFVLLVVHSFTINKMETLKMCLPALIFVIQNNLYYFALQRIDATLFSMTYQLRILTTALLMMIILEKRFSCLQWLSLVLTLLGAITVQLGGHFENKHKASNNAIASGVSDQVAGLTAVLVMCLTNAFGGVYLEAVMKKSDDSVFLQNIRLSLISLPMAIVTIMSDYEIIEKNGFFSGWNPYVWLVVFTSAFGGIVVSSVIRYADNIKKSFCQALALGGTAFVSVSMGDSNFSIYLLAGVILVVISVILYASSPRKKTKTTRDRIANYDLKRVVYDDVESTASSQKDKAQFI